MKRVTTIVALALGLAVMAQEALAPKNLAYLVEGAARIYVVDESRCSAGPGKPEGGQWYLIEGEKKLNDLREALAKVPVAGKGGCLCGGPDVHFYVEKTNSEFSYFGLDCGMFIKSIQLPEALQGVLGPSKKEFIGILGGQTYIVDIPLNVDEQEAREKFNEAGFTLLLGGYWNGASEAMPRDYALQRVAPVHVELLVGPLKNPKTIPGVDWEQIDTANKSKVYTALRQWLDGHGLGLLEMAPAIVKWTETGRNGITYSAEAFLKDPEAVRKALAKTETHNNLVSVLDVEYRTPAEIEARSKYQAALLLPGFATPSELDRIKKVLPGIGRVVPLCECHETKGSS